jgi:ubiquinone/menaquinone biosynthesis C-methylase UbiE
MNDYPLGYSDAEGKRLTDQGAMLKDLTEELLLRAGLSPGMRVLDLGCGVGDVSLLAAQIVGESGSVLAVDRAVSSLENARRRAKQCGAAKVTFVEADLTTFEPGETFNAMIGRFVLLYLAEPAGVLRRLLPNLRSGGVVAFHEYDISTFGQTTHSPFFTELQRWVFEGFRAGGAELDMGSRLYSTFLRAGLPCPELTAAQLAFCGPHAPAYEYATRVVRSLLPTIERHGIATAADVQIDTLADRFRADAVSREAIVFVPRLVGAWARTPNPVSPVA